MLNADEEVGLGAEEGEGQGGGREEDSDLREDEGEPYGEEGPALGLPEPWGSRLGSGGLRRRAPTPWQSECCRRKWRARSENSGGI
jgi:hypothetical protein